MMNTPLISVIMPVYNVEPEWLDKAVASLQNQTYARWELCAADDGSTRADTKACLKKHAARDPRIKASFQPRNAGISAASNIALAMAEGEYVALMDNDDEVTPDAFYWVVKEINAYPEADFIYSDECNIDGSDPPNRFGFIYKPDYSPEFLKRCMYTAHLTVYKAALVRKAGGFNSAHDFAQDYDLALRISEQAVCVRHIERVLYLWRAIEGSFAAGGKPGIEIAGARAAAAMLKRRGINGVIVPSNFGFPYKAITENSPPVSVILPTDNYERAASVIPWLTKKTAYTNFEIIAVCDTATKTRLETKLGYIKNLSFCEYNRPYNFSDKCNAGAKQAQGGIFLFLQDKLDFPREGWLDALTELLAANPEIGGVSPKVLRPDDTIQYAGAITGGGRLVETPYDGCHKDAIDPFWSRYNWTREVSVLSATCLAVRRDVFIQAGGFDAYNTPDKYSNADLSFKIRALGFTCVYNNRAEVVNRLGGRADSWRDSPAFFSHEYLKKKWGAYLRKDPYFTDSMKKAILNY